MSDPRNSFPDNVYWSLTYRNEEEVATTLKFPTNSSSTIIHNPMIYYLLIEKFTLSNRAIPIMQFDNRDRRFFFYVNNLINPIYIRARPATYRGNLITSALTSSDEFYMSIYSIQQFIEIMNDSLAGAATLSILPDGRFNFDAPAPLNLIFSTDLYNLFPTFDATYANSRYQIIFKPSAVNPGAVYATQESKALYALHDIQTILVLSNNLPIIAQGYVTASDPKQKFKILNDFPVIYFESQGIDKSDWVFESNEYRPIDFQSPEPIQVIEYDIRLIRKNGEIVPYYIMPGEVATITFRFAKKALFNNEYNLANESDRIRQNPQYSYHRR